MFVPIILLAFMSYVSGALLPCPKLTGAANFNATSFYQGRWYEVARLPNKVESRGDCVFVEITTDASGNYISKLTEVVNNKYNYVETMTYVDPDSPAVIDYFSRNITAEEKIAMISLTVLAFEPNSYVINYECINDETRNIKHEYGWILSRSKKLEGASRRAVDAFIDATPFLSRDRFMWDHFDDKICKVTA